jgi:ribosomal protein S27E
MGDRIWLQIKCGGCGEPNPPAKDYEEDPMENGVFYAPSSGAMDFTCFKCKNINWIETGFHGRVVDDKELKELYKREGFA